MNFKGILSNVVCHLFCQALLLYGLTECSDGAPSIGVDACAEMRSCVSPFPMLVDLVENDLAKGLAVLTYDVVLNNTCRQLPELKTCLQATKSCSVFKVYHTAGAIRRILEYLCAEGRDAFLSEMDCFFRDGFQTGLTQCTDMMSIEVDTVQMMVQGGIVDSKKFCKVLEKLLKCVKKRVTLTCSARAGDSAYEVHHRIIENILKSLSCPTK